MDDLISRQAVLDYIDSMPFEVTEDGRYMVRRIRLTEYIADTLPPAERKKGRWIHERLASTTGGSYPIVRCSVCSGTIPFEWETRFCPNCGAEMRKETEDAEVH